MVENVTPYVGIIMQRLMEQNAMQVCSELSRLECRVKPRQDNNSVLLRAYDDYFDYLVTEIVPLSREVIDLATDLRARYNFRTPDAIHIACAINSACDLLLTNDRQLTRCQEIAVAILPTAP